MPCQRCLELEQELKRLQELRFQQIKESDVFKVLYAQFSEMILEVDKKSKREGAELMREQAAKECEDNAENLSSVSESLLKINAAHIRAIPLPGEENADLQFPVSEGLHRKKNFDA